MDLAGSLITHIDKTSSAQLRCLLEGQQDGTWMIWKISGCLKVTQGLSRGGFIHLEAGFWGLCCFLPWSDILHQESKVISKKSPIHSSSIPWLRPQSLLLTFPVSFCLQICIHSSTSVMSATTASQYTFYHSHLIKINCIVALSAIELTIQHTSYLPVLILKRLQWWGAEFTQMYNKTTCRHEALTTSNFIQKLQGKQKECALQDQVFAWNLHITKKLQCNQPQ